MIAPDPPECEMLMSDLLDRLPPEIVRNRVLGTDDSAAFCGISVPHWRRMYRKGLVPAPLKLGTRKLGWRVGDLIEWLEGRARAR